MKNFGIAVLALLSIASAFADETGVVMTPDLPTNCEHDHSWVDRVENITKLSESDREVVFRFETTVGKCKDGEFVPTELVAKFEAVSLISDHVVMPWNSDPCSSHIDVLSPTVAQITMHFDKKRLFKKSDEEWFAVKYMPYGYYGGYYPWKVLLLDKPEGAELHIL